MNSFSVFNSRKTFFFCVLALMGAFAAGFAVARVGFDGSNTEVGNLIEDDWSAQGDKYAANLNRNAADNSNSLWTWTNCNRPNIENAWVSVDSGQTGYINLPKSNDPALNGGSWLWLSSAARPNQINC